MILSHVISDTILACISVWVFWHYHQRTPLYNRLLWGFFFLIIGLTALVGVFRFAGNSSLIPLHQSLDTLAQTLGVACVVLAVWALLRNLVVNMVTFSITLIIGLFLFFILILPQVHVFTPVVSAFGILVVMLMGVYGLARRDVRSVWIIAAVMIMALATKTPSLPQPIDPIDFYHYAVALALFCFGKANEEM